MHGVCMALSLGIRSHYVIEAYCQEVGRLEVPWIQARGRGRPVEKGVILKVKNRERERGQSIDTYVAEAQKDID